MTQPPFVPLPGTSKPKLLDQVRQCCRLRHLARKTELAYVNWVRRFVIFHHVPHPLEMGAEEVSTFLTHLAVEWRGSWGHVLSTRSRGNELRRFAAPSSVPPSHERAAAYTDAVSDGALRDSV